MNNTIIREQGVALDVEQSNFAMRLCQLDLCIDVKVNLIIYN